LALKNSSYSTLTRRLAPNPRKPQEKDTNAKEDKHIPSKDMARFLGMIVNNKMNWKGQCAAALAKGQGLVNSIWQVDADILRNTRKIHMATIPINCSPTACYMLLTYS